MNPLRYFVIGFLLAMSFVGYANEDEDHDVEKEGLAEPSPPESGNPLPTRDDQWRFTIAFPMIWLALVIYSVPMIRQLRRS